MSASKLNNTEYTAQPVSVQLKKVSRDGHEGR